MSIRVYHADSNPAIDPHSYRCSNTSGQDAVASGQGRYIALPDGRTAIQLFRNQASREQWIERLEEATARQHDACPMPFLKVQWPESVKKLRAESKVPNLRQLASV
jgi:hypothetical protein